MELFEKFLVQNKCKDEFVLNLSKNTPSDYRNKTLAELKSNKDKENYISGAFNWSAASKSITFWSELHYKWLGFIRTNDSHNKHIDTVIME